MKPLSKRSTLLLIAAVAVAGAVSAFALWPRGLETEASHRAYVAWAVEYADLGSMTASSDLVVRGTVTKAGPGPEHTNPDDGAVLTERHLTVAIDELLHQSDRAPDTGSTITVSDGWWRGTEGFEVVGQPWLQEGDQAYLFLTYDLHLGVYVSIGAEGRVALTDEGPHPSGEHAALWEAEDTRLALTDETDLEALLEATVAEVEAGVHEPVMFEVCEPSVPGDETSEPICTMTY